MKVYVASDHAGFLLKETIVTYLREELAYEVEDVGAHEENTEDDYPDFILPCATKVAGDLGSLGIVIGGSGQGEAMAANSVSGVRAALFYGQVHTSGARNAEGDEGVDGYDIVRLSREHNNANVLSLGARFISPDEAKEAVRVFLETAFSEEERHLRRIKKYS